MWHIARRPQQGHIEVFKVKDRKTSTFLSEEFLAWRQQALAQSVADMLT
jgi:phage portal protein BeeE